MWRTWRSPSSVICSAMSPHAGQRRTAPAPRYSRCAPTGLCWPHEPQPRSTVVISAANSSPSSPAIALPSSHVACASALISSSRWPEAFGADRARRVAEADEEVGGALDEPGGTAHEHAWSGRRLRPDGGEHVGVDAAVVAGPLRRLLAGQGEAGPDVRERPELVAVEHILPAPRGDEQPRVDGVGARRPVAQHRHERHESRAAGDEQQRAAVLDAPGEVPADRAAELELIAGADLVGQVRRDLAVVDALDRQL